MTEQAALDASTRERLRSDLGSTLFVEAGAGTGKTTVITSRIVELVAAGRLRADQLVAITFTEAAAAELRARVRQALEEAAGSVRRPMAEGDRCRQATAEIDRASIDTIHAFAGELLRTYPLEAGLPPEFSTLDDIEQDLRFDERFRAWFEAIADDTRSREAVRRCLLLGLTPGRIHEVAQALQEQRDLLTPDTRWVRAAASQPVMLANRLGAELTEAIELIDRSAPDGHPLLEMVSGLRFAAERVRTAATEAQALTALTMVEGIPGILPGSQAGWPDECRRAKTGLKCVRDDAHAALAEHRTAAFCVLANALKDFVAYDATARAREGVATFHDLLTWARDLLRDDLEVRRRAHDRWTHIFVDEFQDTDPLQAELAYYLCAQPGTVDADWHQLPLESGKLCLVGDPKQSIYRFRRADIAVYEQLQLRVAGSLPLARNFRSVPGIVDWVNHHFGAAMTHNPGVQTAYQPLAADIPGDAGPCVWTMGGEVGERQPQVWLREAEAVAEGARRVVDEAWLVSDRTDGERTRRAALWRDVCVLMPTRTNLRRLERALEHWDVPYRIESGELVIATQEVRDLVSCLRAIDDPSDQVALVAALRSPVYGCSDPELLEWVESGGRLAHDYPGDGAGDRVRASLADLRRFHELRHEQSVPALIERLIDERLLVAGAFGQRRPREAWRRYRYVVGRARAFAATGRATLREFVEWMEGLEREQARAAAGAIVESDEDAVRVLTIHQAKGLEFPVVILTGLGSRQPFRPPSAIADRGTGRVELGARTADFATPGYADAVTREQTLAEAESLRLLYVAATRARDHLIMSLFRGAGARAAASHAGAIATSAITFAGPIAQLDLRGTPPVATVPAGLAPEPVENPDEDRHVEAEWMARRGAAIGSLSGIRLATATGLARMSETEVGGRPETPADIATLRRGRASTALGRAVHAVLQTIDLATLDGLNQLATVRAAAEGIPRQVPRVVELVRRAAAAPPVRRAIEVRHWREVPLGGTVGGTLIEGFIDLLYEVDGGLGIVDYKTDDITPGEVDTRWDRYRIQGGVYALLAEAATGRPVRSVDFVFAALGVVRTSSDIAADVRVAADAAGRLL